MEFVYTEDVPARDPVERMQASLDFGRCSLDLASEPLGEGDVAR